MWITTNSRKFFKRWEYQTTLPASCEICMQVRKQQLEPDMEQQTGSTLGKEYVKAVCCHPAYLTYKQSMSCEMPGWINAHTHTHTHVQPGWAELPYCSFMLPFIPGLPSEIFWESSS